MGAHGAARRRRVNARHDGGRVSVDRAVRDTRRRQDRAHRGLQVPLVAGGALASGSHLPRRRRGPSAAAAPSPGAVFRHPRRRQPRVEARGGSPGRSRDSLLDTYESERKAHARAWIEIATQLSSIINTTDSEVAAGRDAHMLANPMPYTNETPPLGPGLHGDAPPPAGVLSEQAVLGDGTRLDDLTGWRFLVAMTPAVEAELTSTARDLIADEQWFHVLDSSSEVARELLRRHGASGALVVRPDRYVLGIARCRGTRGGAGQMDRGCVGEGSKVNPPRLRVRPFPPWSRGVRRCGRRR